MTTENGKASGGEPEAGGKKNAKNTRQPHCSTIPSVFQAPTSDEQFLADYWSFLADYARRNNIPWRPQ